MDLDELDGVRHAGRALGAGVPLVLVLGVARALGLLEPAPVFRVVLGPALLGDLGLRALLLLRLLARLGRLLARLLLLRLLARLGRRLLLRLLRLLLPPVDVIRGVGVVLPVVAHLFSLRWGRVGLRPRRAASPAFR